MFDTKEKKIGTAVAIGLNVLLLLFAISVRWENETWYMNMDLISSNFLGFFFGFILAAFLIGGSSQKEVQERDRKWVKQIDLLEDENNQLRNKLKGLNGE